MIEATTSAIVAVTSVGVTSAASLGTIRPWINAKQMRMLAVTSHARNPNVQEVPSLPEAGVKADDLQIWMGVFAPKGTPQAIIERMNGYVRAATQDPTIQAALLKQGMTVKQSTAAEHTAFAAMERERWADWVRLAKIEAQ